MITSAQMRAARALARIDQRQLADLAGLSVPTIQRMEASDGQVRGVVDSLVRVVAALDLAGVALIGDGAASGDGGRGVRLKSPAPDRAVIKGHNARQGSYGPPDDPVTAPPDLESGAR